MSFSDIIGQPDSLDSSNIVDPISNSRPFVASLHRFMELGFNSETAEAICNAIKLDMCTDDVVAYLINLATSQSEIKSSLIDVLLNTSTSASCFLRFLCLLAAKEEEQGKLEEALETLSLAIQHCPFNIELLARSGLIYANLGNLDLGIEFIMQATAVDPSDCITRYYQGKFLYISGDYCQALECFIDYISCVRLEVLAPDAETLLALCYLMNNDLDSAVASIEKVLQGSPEDPSALINSSTIYRCLGEVDTSILCCEKVLKLLNDPLREGFMQAFSNLMFSYAAKGIDCLPTSRDTALSIWRKVGICNELHKSYDQIHCQRGDKCKLGILTSEIGDHVVGYFLESFLAYFPRDKIEVDLILGCHRHEVRTERLISYANNCIDISGKSVDDARVAVAQRGYDIIMDTSGFTANSRLSLLAHRCAPVQCHYIGYHASTHLPTLDYFIADPEFVPASIENQFSEKILRIDCPWIARQAPANLPSAFCELKCDHVIMCSFNQTAKISLKTLDWWSQALLSVSNSVLVVKDRFATSKKFQDKVFEYLKIKGVDDSRISFVGAIQNWEDHMSFYNSVDIVLDATPWSAATTAFDAMSMGVPFIAIRGEEASSRMSSSVLQAAGRSYWIADCKEQYAKIALEISAQKLLYREKRYEQQQINLASSAFDPRLLADRISSILLSLAKK